VEEGNDIFDACLRLVSLVVLVLVVGRMRDAIPRALGALEKIVGLLAVHRTSLNKFLKTFILVVQYCRWASGNNSLVSRLDVVQKSKLPNRLGSLDHAGDVGRVATARHMNVRGKEFHSRSSSFQSHFSIYSCQVHANALKNVQSMPQGLSSRQLSSIILSGPVSSAVTAGSPHPSHQASGKACTCTRPS
jgi:hypothetical protein